jgi:Methyltransferase domain
MQLLTPNWKIEIDHLAHNLNYLDIPRPFTRMLKQQCSGPLVGCEIGYGWGRNFESLLAELPIKTLFSVDPLKPYSQGKDFYDYHGAHDKEFTERRRRLEGDSRTVFIEATSDEAFSNAQVPDNLDFIYIDGNHDFDHCTRDIQNSMQFVKHGGFVGGHDFVETVPAVMDAVITYSVHSSIIPTIKMPDFWFKRK